jgi:prolipoprotein diacylglyceryltransferase
MGKGSDVAAPPGLMIQKQQRWGEFIGQEPWGRGKKKNALKVLNEDLHLMNEMMKMPDNLSGKNLPLAQSKPPQKPQYQLPERLI